LYSLLIKIWIFIAVTNKCLVLFIIVTYECILFLWSFDCLHTRMYVTAKNYEIIHTDTWYCTL
jgi:hypothetical protein